MITNEDEYALLSFLDVIFTPSGRNTETPLSNVLSKTLNNMGYDDDTRRTFRESNTTMEILDTLCLDLANRNYSCTILGGQAEGAYVTSKGSKASASVRYLFCRNDLIVNGDINELSPNNNVELLMVSDEITKPGYVKLQVVLNGVPQKTKGCDIDLPDNTQADYRNRLCIFKTHPDMLRVEKHLGLETTTRMITGDKPDILYESYKCESWPDVARNWQNRVRHYNWPSRYDLEQMKALGILLVPVGCSDSIERHLEFKICFFLQERYLMDTLNETQHKCYVLLKMINNSIISGLVNESALISYHLKMCLFHVIENTSVGTWTPSNLLCCLRHCLNCVLKCTISGLCPDYFNPHENLFCGRIHGELQSKLRNVLEMLLQSDFYFLTYIECGNLGGLLKKAIRNEPLRTDESQDLVSNNIESYIEKGRYVVLVKDRILSRCYNEDLETCLQQHLQMIKRLRAIDTLAGHSKSETQRAIGLALSWVELSFMNNLVAWAVTREDRTEIRDILFSHQWNINARDTSAFSAKLKQATYMHMQRFHTSSLEILNGLKGLLGPHKISICGCRFFMKTILSKQMKVELMQASDAEIRKIHCMPCLIFLPTELVPEAIRNTTSTNSASNSERTSNRFGNKWAVVDSKVLLFYLLYLNHSELKMSNDAVDDIEQLLKVLKNDQNLGHKETGWSILGWIYSQEGQHDRARVCFIESSTQLDAYMTASTRRISRVCESGSVMQK